MERFLFFLLTNLMGFIGIVVYSLFKAKDYISNNTFNKDIFVEENKLVWIWSFITINVLSLILLIEPTANELIKQVSGLDLNNTKTGWLLFGAGLCGLVRNAKK